MSTKNFQARRKYSLSTGRVAEIRFIRSARSKGLIVTKSSHTEDMHKHIDYWVAMSSGKAWGIDVKGNNLPDEIWCEFTNVNGDLGWMYGGAHYIAFDMPEEGGFSIVGREELAFYCEKHVKDEFVSDANKAYMKKYRRQGRKDTITKLRLDDLKSMLSYRVWKYDQKY